MLNIDLIKLIFTYTYEPKYKMLDWVEQNLNFSKNNFYYLSKNKRASSYLQTKIAHINWEQLARNESDQAINIIKQELNSKDCPFKLIDLLPFLAGNRNDNAVKILFENIDKIHIEKLVLIASNTNDIVVDYVLKNFNYLYDIFTDRSSFLHNLNHNSNSKVVKFLIANHHKYMILTYFFKNSNPLAVSYLINYLNKGVNTLTNFSENINTKAVEFLIQNQKYINWYFFSSNSNDLACDLLLSNLEEISLLNLINNKNPKILHILEKNKDLYSPDYFLENPIIFEVDKKATNEIMNNKIFQLFNYQS